MNRYLDIVVYVLGGTATWHSRLCPLRQSTLLSEAVLSPTKWYMEIYVLLLLYFFL